MNQTIVTSSEGFRVLNPSDIGMPHIMIDLETMSVRRDAAIMAIGAIAFDLETGRKGEEFYCKVDLVTCQQADMHFDADTIYWWLQQNERVREEMVRDKKPIYFSLLNLCAMVKRCQDGVQVWSNGLSFDIAILRNAFDVHRIPVPWHHTKERDVRTLVSLLPEVKADMAFRGLKHHPLADCRHQIEYCAEIYHQLKRNRE